MSDECITSCRMSIYIYSINAFGLLETTVQLVDVDRRSREEGCTDFSCWDQTKSISPNNARFFRTWISGMKIEAPCCCGRQQLLPERSGAQLSVWPMAEWHTTVCTPPTRRPAFAITWRVSLTPTYRLCEILPWTSGSLRHKAIQPKKWPTDALGLTRLITFTPT